MTCKAAQALARMGKGKKKTLTDQQREEKRQQFNKIRHLRWAKKEQNNGTE